MDNRSCICPIDIAVTSGVSVIITIPQIFLKDGCRFIMHFDLSGADYVKYRDLITGTETVSIRNGVSGEAYVLEDSVADILYADKLKIGWHYHLRYGNNGASNTAGTVGGVGHFINLNTPCCATKYNPANTAIPQITAQEV